ncbi:MAG: DUF4149 domain-containing protein [Pseudomonadota bacterium]
MAELFSLYAIAMLLGGMVFFSFVFSPLIFINLPAETAGPFIRRVFPWYFLMVAVLFIVAAGALAPFAPFWAVIAGIMALLGIANRQLLMPWINRLRDAQIAGDAAAGKKFDLLHKASVAINFVQMIAAAILLWQFG